ncbi:MAG: phosphotransferase [Idiomarina sp.]|nr:phosphotransferase [Idiomarina sp.]
MNSTNRLELLQAWTAQHSALPQPTLQLLAGDASFRRYYRVTSTAQQSQVLVDAPPPESLEPFHSVALAYLQAGVLVPQVHASDTQLGAMLLDDLGDCLLLQTEAPAYDRYRQAIEALPNIMRVTETRLGALPPYDLELLKRENALFFEWLIGRHLGLELTAAEEKLWQGFTDLLNERSLQQPRVGVHRDYHSRNLMITADNQLAVIDFQDAVVGPITYDLVSLLRDCYVKWPADFVDGLVAYAHDMLREEALLDQSVSLAEFQEWFDWTGLQRHTKASGIFARLFHRDGKSGYLADIPQTVGYLTDIAGRYEILNPYYDWLEERIVPALNAKNAAAVEPACEP